MAGLEMNRRSFLKRTAGGIAGSTASKDLSITLPEGIDNSPRQSVDDPRDGGIFGHWMRDEFGLPAFRYEMDHVRDPRAIWDTVIFGKSSRHWHQLGNDRITAVATNEGWFQLYSHEFGPRWINMHRPDRRSYAGGVSFIQLGDRMLSTF